MQKKMSVLFLGTGPAAIQTAVLIKHYFSVQLGISGRNSVSAQILYKAFAENGNCGSVTVQNEKHKKLEGEVVFDYVFKDYTEVDGKWDIIVLAVTNDAYLAVLKSINQDVLKSVETIILISSCIGSTSIIKNFLQTRKLCTEIITFSTYYGDTKMNTKLNNPACVLTKNIKKRIYLSTTSQNKERGILFNLIKILRDIGIDTVLMESGFAAESRCISTYVHPPILMNSFSLSHILNLKLPPKYVYKFFPEGPITQYVIHDMRQQQEEIQTILSSLNVPGFNFLKFINDDNYPVMDACLSRNDVNNFEYFDHTKQEYLLYIRYASILVDPYSTPDDNGRYFDFSAAPLQRIYKNIDGYWYIPRSPKEDYYRLSLLKGIATYKNIPTVVIDKLVSNYRETVIKFRNESQNELLSEDFWPDAYGEDIHYLISTL